MDEATSDLYGYGTGAGVLSKAPSRLIKYGNADYLLSHPYPNRPNVRFDEEFASDARGDFVAVEVSPVVLILGLGVVTFLGVLAITKR